MNIVVDIGNTFSKLGLYLNGKREKVYHRLTNEQLVQRLVEYGEGHCMIASVRENVDFLQGISFENIMVYYLDEHTPLPIKNLYKTPKTLGRDRLAGAVGANMLFPNNNSLVIDVGTAITYDFINDRGEFLGGGISPGVEMKLKALNSYTDNLPVIDDHDGHALIGESTRDSILSGVFEGTWAEITGMIARYNEKFSELRVIMCGGGLNHFESKIKEPIFVAPELVLDGLNRILVYNVGKES